MAFSITWKLIFPYIPEEVTNRSMAYTVRYAVDNRGVSLAFDPDKTIYNSQLLPDEQPEQMCEAVLSQLVFNILGYSFPLRSGGGRPLEVTPLSKEQLIEILYDERRKRNIDERGINERFAALSCKRRKRNNDERGINGRFAALSCK